MSQYHRAWIEWRRAKHQARIWYGTPRGRLARRKLIAATARVLQLELA